jgi:hypothetical protein
MCGKAKDRDGPTCRSCRDKNNQAVIKHADSNLNYRIAHNLRSRLRLAIRNNHKSGSAVEDLGCSIEEFREYLSERFQPGMTWDNWGFGEGMWHIDHVTPLSHFDLTDREQFLAANHYTNMQPMWQPENLRKNNRTTPSSR